MTTPAAVLPALDDFDPHGQHVLVRVDFNVPLEDANGRRAVADDTRLRRTLPTLTELLDRGAVLVLMSHLGRPDGAVDPALSMQPVGARLAALLGRDVRTLDDIVGPAVEAAADAAAPGDVLLLENLRFDPGEKANDPAFARALAELGQVYVNDAFGTAHRAAASIVGVPRHLPAYAGRLMAREIEMLGAVRDAPATPLVLMLGGAKIADKLGVIHALQPKADRILVGGGMANTLLAADGVPMGASLVEAAQLDEAERILEMAGDQLMLPVDLVVADDFAADAARRVVALEDGVPDGWQALDIGPQTVERYEAALDDAATVIWNGPMGVFELPPFAEGTLAVARALAALDDAMTVVGGGDSAAAVQAAGVADDIDWVSTGGGAALTFLQGEPLPALAALRRERAL